MLMLFFQMGSAQNIRSTACMLRTPGRIDQKKNYMGKKIRKITSKLQ